MNAHKIIQIALIFSIVVPAIERVWYYVRWKCTTPRRNNGNADDADSTDFRGFFN